MIPSPEPGAIINGSRRPAKPASLRKRHCRQSRPSWRMAKAPVLWYCNSRAILPRRVQPKSRRWRITRNHSPNSIFAKEQPWSEIRSWSTTSSARSRHPWRKQRGQPILLGQMRSRCLTTTANYRRTSRPMTPFGKPADHHVKHRREKDAEKRHAQHATEDGCAEGLAHLRAGTSGENQGDHAKNEIG